MMITLFKIRCEDFIESCEDEFDPDPWISYFGTCFTSKHPWNVTGSGGLQHRIVKLNTSTDYSAGKLLLYKYFKNIFMCLLDFNDLIGERQAFSGISMVLHQTDHPLAALDNRAINLESGTSNRLILSASETNLTKLEVDYDQFGWSSWKAKKWDFQFCVLSDSLLDRSLKAYGYPAWTAYNCEQFLRLQNPLNCSCALTQGNKLNESVLNFTGMCCIFA